MSDISQKFSNFINGSLATKKADMAKAQTLPKEEGVEDGDQTKLTNVITGEKNAVVGTQNAVEGNLNKITGKQVDIFGQ